MIRVCVSKDELDQLPPELRAEYRQQEDGGFKFAPEFDEQGFAAFNVGRMRGQIDKARRSRDRAQERLATFALPDGSLLSMDEHAATVRRLTEAEAQLAILQRTADDQPRRHREMLEHHRRNLENQVAEAESQAEKWRNQVATHVETLAVAGLLRRVRPIDRWSEHLGAVIARRVGHEVRDGQVVAVVRGDDGSAIDAEALVGQVREQFAECCAGDRREGVGRSVAGVGSRAPLPNAEFVIAADDARDFAKFEAVEMAARAAGTHARII